MGLTFIWRRDGDAPRRNPFASRKRAPILDDTSERAAIVTERGEPRATPLDVAELEAARLRATQLLEACRSKRRRLQRAPTDPIRAMALAQGERTLVAAQASAGKRAERRFKEIERAQRVAAEVAAHQAEIAHIVAQEDYYIGLFGRG